MPYRRGVRTPGSAGYRRSRKLPVQETPRERAAYKPGRWEYFPESSRVSRARYDSENALLEVDWVDGGLSYLYRDVTPTEWRSMRRVTSVGKFVNRVLNQHDYAPKVD